MRLERVLTRKKDYLLKITTISSHYKYLPCKVSWTRPWLLFCWLSAHVSKQNLGLIIVTFADSFKRVIIPNENAGRKVHQRKAIDNEILYSDTTGKLGVWVGRESWGIMHCPLSVSITTLNLEGRWMVSTDWMKGNRVNTTWMLISFQVVPQKLSSVDRELAGEKISSPRGIKSQLISHEHCQPQEVGGRVYLSLSVFSFLIKLIISPDNKGIYLIIP